MVDTDFHRFRAHPVAPQEAGVGQVVRITTSQLGEALVVHVGGDRLQQLVTVGRVVAGRRRSGAAEHTEGEADLEGVGVARQVGHVHRLQVGRLDRGVQLGRVTVLGLEAVGDGAAYGLLAHGHGRPFLRGVALRPGASAHKGVGRVELTFEGEDGSGAQYWLGHADFLMRWRVRRNGVCSSGRALCQARRGDTKAGPITRRRDGG